MRFFAAALFFLGVNAGDDDVSASSSTTAAVSTSAAVSSPAVQNRAFSTVYLPPGQGGFRPSCPYNNCRSCTGAAGCYWSGSTCSNICQGGFCASTPSQCGGCQSDFQCNGGRCENGQCVGAAGDRACDYYTSCSSCLSRPNCLWDPNTLRGSCKPKEQCDFTYQPRALALSVSATAAPPASACVRSLDRCGQQDFSGTALDLNNQRGVGCTNDGQCRSDQYCFSCSKCVGSCGRCRDPGFPVSGFCGPASRCPIDNDSISGTCPISSGYPSINYPSSCNYYACSSCTAAYGCVWSGTSCYYATTPCYTSGCANTPDQCYSAGPVINYPSSCNYYDCSSCTAAYGCVWSGTSCYYTTTPCYTSGCANTPDQCFGFRSYYPTTTYPNYPTTPYYPPTPYYPTTPYYPIQSCQYYTTCTSCLTNPACLWDPNSLFATCKPKEQCDFTYRALSLSTTAAAAPTATACVRTPDRCYQQNFGGAALTPNPDRGYGCTTHDQCGLGQYCFACSKCRGACSPCAPGLASVSGGCGPVYRCPIDLDSINGLCPVA